MHQTRKGNQWFFGAKAHIGVDSKEGEVHSVCTSAASVSDDRAIYLSSIVCGTAKVPASQVRITVHGLLRHAMPLALSPERPFQNPGLSQYIGVYVKDEDIPPQVLQ